MKTSLDPKPCTDCGRVLPRGAFHSNGPGVAGRCKDCTSAHKRVQYERDPHSQKERTRHWKGRNPEKVAAQQRRWSERQRSGPRGRGGAIGQRADISS